MVYSVDEAKAKLFLVDLYELFGNTTFNHNNIKQFIENYSFSNKTELDINIINIINTKLNNLSSKKKNQIMIKNNQINYNDMISFLTNNKELILDALSKYYNNIENKEEQQRIKNYKIKQNENTKMKNAKVMKKMFFRETKLNFEAKTNFNIVGNDALKVAVISFNTEAIELFNTRLEQGKGNKTQVFNGDGYSVKSTGFKRIFTPFFKGGERIIPVEKKPGLEYIRKLIDKISENELPDLIFFGMQESNMTPKKSDKSLQSMLYELNARVKKDNNENKNFYSLYRSGAARIGKEGYRGNRLGIFVRGNITLEKPNSPTTQEFNKTSCGKESAIVFKGLEGKNKIEYTHHSGSSENSPKFYCDPYPVLEMWRYLFGDKFEKQSKLTKSNNYGYLKVNKNNKEYSFSVMNLHLPFIRSNIEGHFGAKQRDELLNQIYENMYVPDSTLILMGDLNYRFVSDKNNFDKNNLANESRFGKNDPRKKSKIITCPLQKGKPEFEYNNSKNQNKSKVVKKYGICDRVIYKEANNKQAVYLQTRGETHSNEVKDSDHALVYSVFKIE